MPRSNRFNLMDEIAPRDRSIDFYSVGNLLLPNPDPVLKKQGRDISLYNDLLTDDRVSGGMINRNAASKGMVWEIEKGAAPVRQHKAVIDVFNRLAMNRIIEQILKARAFGYAPMEVMWALKDGITVPVDLVLKPQRWFMFDFNNRFCFWSKDNVLSGEELPLYKFLCPTNEADYANPYGLGLLSRCFWPVVFKRGGWRFWVNFCEKFGQVWPVGKLPRSTTDEERAKLLTTLETMVQDGVAVIPDDGSVEFLEAGDKTGTSDLFRGIIAEANNAISTVWLGHASAGEATPGKLGGDKTASDVREDLRDDDANLIMETLQQVIDWTCEINWGSAENSPTFILREKDRIDTTQAERDDKLSQTMVRSGLKLTSVYYRKTYGLDEEDIEAGTPLSVPPLPQGEGGRRPGNGLAFAETRQEFTAEQQMLEVLADQVINKAAEVMQANEAKLRDAVMNASSYADAMQNVLNLYPNMNLDRLTALLEGTILSSSAFGRYTATGDE